MSIRSRFIFFLFPLFFISLFSLALILFLLWHRDLSLVLPSPEIAQIDERFREGLTFGIFIIALFSFFIITSLLLFANKITRPMQKLNNYALAIAAGQQEDSLDIKGPKEIQELANTLHTINECLQENINRLKENALLREKMYGEDECARLLQNHMFQKVIDECESDAFAVKAISFFSAKPKGLLLDFFDENEGFSLHFVEAKERGFKGMYSLLTNYKRSKEERKRSLNKKFPLLKIFFDKGTRNLSFLSNQFPPPLLWSIEEKKIKNLSLANTESPEGQNPLSTAQIGDFFFLYTKGIIQLLEGEKDVASFLTKILKFFSEDGLETCSSMLQRELSFLLKKKELKEDVHLLCFQILN